ncbi:isochorismatase family protein [Streptomyces sp. WI04-05B]|uniref:isochorismatase family protein n=1 Tax=Streptomyces TaxID=1883 RepID=UPI0029B757D3|nr:MULTISPECIES: isochorismatase family protein [unclassified Streptomyces]MDX2542811.1 isochorismatase family protein [Streptomyces sp. WI04-05B]MDX2588355.1 isochorismatase family protein [Streptomyces sp. WI04-05A]MDX3747351.1 isochorismatase family protein [Streptomyces sp. AK08-02]
MTPVPGTGEAATAGAEPEGTGAAEEDYRRAGLAGGLTPGTSPALLLVDPARAYVDPACPLYAGAGAEGAAEAMRELLSVTRGAGIPVIVTRVVLRPDGSDGGVFFRKVPSLRAFVEGSPYGEFIEGLAPDPGDLMVTKQYPSAFFGTPLSTYLTSHGIDTLLIAGLTTSGCVRATALDAMQHGFVPVVVEEAVGDRDAGVHAANLFDIRHKIGEVWGMGRVAEYLSPGGI